MHVQEPQKASQNGHHVLATDRAVLFTVAKDVSGNLIAREGGEAHRTCAEQRAKKTASQEAMIDDRGVCKPSVAFEMLRVIGDQMIRGSELRGAAFFDDAGITQIPKQRFEWGLANVRTGPPFPCAQMGSNLFLVEFRQR
jgi:hypothetical protein